MLHPLLTTKREGHRHFQNDNAPVHTVRITKNWLQNQTWAIIPWPSQPPDMNPIEALWLILKRRIAQIKHVGRTQLIQVIRQQWTKIIPGDCYKLVDSMPRRVLALIKAKENHTKC